MTAARTLDIRDAHRPCSVRCPVLRGVASGLLVCIPGRPLNNPDAANELWPIQSEHRSTGDSQLCIGSAVCSGRSSLTFLITLFNLPFKPLHFLRLEPVVFAVFPFSV